MFKKHKKGFTIIELIVVMAVLAILITAGTVGFTNYVKQAHIEILKTDTRLIENALQSIILPSDMDWEDIRSERLYREDLSAFSIYDFKGDQQNILLCVRPASEADNEEWVPETGEDEINLYTLKESVSKQRSTHWMMISVVLVQ